MPVSPNPLFQPGAIPEDAPRPRLPWREAEYRKKFLSLYL